MPVVVSSITVLGTLTHCALLYSRNYLKAAQMNKQCSLIQKFMLYEFELGSNTVEASKNICCTKGKGSVDHSTVTRCFKKFQSVYKNLHNQVKSARPKTMDSEAMLLAIEANPLSSTWRVSGELIILLSCVTWAKNIWIYWIVSH